MNTAPLIRRVCQFTGRIAHPPHTSDALQTLGASERPAPDSTPAGAGHSTK